MNYNVTVNGKVYSVTVEKTGAAAPAAVAAPVAAAPVDGTVKSVAVNVGATVNTDDLLVTLG